MTGTSLLNIAKALTCCIICLTVGHTELSAQRRKHHSEEEAPKANIFRDFHFEISANTIPILRTISDKGSDSLDRSPYLTNLRLSWKNWGIRAGAGGQYNHKNSYLEGFRDSRTVTTKALNYRIGADYRVAHRNRFSYSIGIDWVSNYFKFNDVNDSGFDVIEQVNLVYSTGGGLSLNGHWWLNKHFGLGVESSLYYTTGKQTQGRRFINFPELNDDLTSSDIEEVSLPVALFATWRF